MVATTLNERIRQLHAEGLVDREIGERVGRTKGTVARRRTLLGLPINGCHRWTMREQRTAVEMAMAGKSRREIADTLGLPRTAVANRLSRLGMGGELDSQLIRSAAMRSRAWDLFGRGYRPPAVAKILGVTPGTARRYRRMMPDWWNGAASREAGELA